MPGSKPGERRGGRQVGSLNKVTADIKALAQSFGPDAIRNLAKMSGLMPGEPGSDSDQARIAATKELLDRGFGKSVQPQSGPDGEGNPVMEVIYRWADPKDLKSD